MKWTPCEIAVASVTAAIVLAMLAVAEGARTTHLVCDEPRIITVTETATGVVVLCGDVEGEP